MTHTNDDDSRNSALNTFQTIELQTKTAAEDFPEIALTFQKRMCFP
jgi:hypothetical protein